MLIIFFLFNLFSFGIILEKLINYFVLLNLISKNQDYIYYFSYK